MRVLNAGQMREADRRTIEEIGIPSIVLMENAGRQVVSAMEAAFDAAVGGARGGARRARQQRRRRVRRRARVLWQARRRRRRSTSSAPWPASAAMRA